MIDFVSNMDIYSIINTLVTIFLGGGWFIYYKANKRKAEGEATQSQASGWQAMQVLYEKTISDFDGYSELMRKERQVLINENNELRKNYKKIDDEINQLKRRLSRQGRKIDALSPFLCGVVGCLNRKRVNVAALGNDEVEDGVDKNNNNENKQNENGNNQEG